jgi:hypothetical protein
MTHTAAWGAAALCAGLAVGLLMMTRRRVTEPVEGSPEASATCAVMSCLGVAYYLMLALRW